MLLIFHFCFPAQSIIKRLLKVSQYKSLSIVELNFINNQKSYLQNYLHMRVSHINSQANRKKIDPIRSPSPDISNSNIIADTRAPLDQIHRYKSSMSPHRSPLHNSYSYLETDKLKAQNHQLKQQIAHLIQQTQDSQSAFDHNQRLIFEVKRLQNQNQMLKSKSKGFNENASEQIIEQFKDRMQQLTEQNKRLGIKLQKQQSKIVYYERENNIYKNEAQFFKQQCQGGSFSINQNSRTLNHQIQEICRNYENAADNHFNDFQIIINNKLAQFQKRIEGVNIKQKMVEEKLDRQKRTHHKNSPTPQRVSISTEFMTDRKSRQIRYDSKYQSPVSYFNKQQQIYQQLQQLSSKYKKSLQELEYYRSYTLQCEKKIQLYRNKLQEKQQKFEPNFRPNIVKKVSQSQIQLLRDKVKYLESQLEHKVTLLSSMQQQSNDTHNELVQRLKRYELSISNFQEQSKENQQKFYKQQQKYQNLLRQYNNYKSANQTMKNQTSQNEKLKNENNNLQKQLKQMNLVLQRYTQSYLEMINQARSILTSEQMHNIYENTNKIEKQVINLQMLKKEHTEIIQQLKKKLLMNQEQIIELQTRNKILTSQNMQLTQQLKRLKQIIKEYTGPKNRNQLKNSYSFHSDNISCKMKQLVESAVKCMDNIQDKINQSLRE